MIKGVSFSEGEETSSPVYTPGIGVNNSWVNSPYIVRINNGDVRAAKAARNNHGNYLYLLKWRA